ncbi:replication-relaxation family protein [Bdellovibrio sp. HCB290]|uniref:replication-relaxation family protein n=1 Tax=Bdellovibrio sp. HCB290 TaxID=3394356 RepID=UPI0039B48743
MKQLSFEGLEFDDEKVKKSRSVVLTDRDLNILEYILEMKFSSVQDVFEIFFKINQFGNEAASTRAAVARLQQLTKSGYLNGIHSFSERRKYYLTTQKGYRSLCERRPNKEYIQPVQSIDHRTFNHDKLVLEARIALENKRAARNWISDRRLRSNKDLAGGLTNHAVPDGIFINPEGQRVALELEYTSKSRSDHIEKIKRYVMMMRSESPTTKVFDQVIYICAYERIVEMLVQETKIYGELFQVKSFDEFFSPGRVRKIATRTD